jgi:hypothetical protein
VAGPAALAPAALTAKENAPMPQRAGHKEAPVNNLMVRTQ